jgi:uncharacterized membrane protein YkvI
MLALTFLIISSIIGAGFATGAELVSFFGRSALSPFVIGLIAGALFFAIMSALVLAQPRGNNSQKIQRNSNRLFAPVAFVFYTAMIAGISEISGHLAGLFAVTICVLIVWFGFEKLLFINKFLTVFILAVLLVVTIPHQIGIVTTPIDSFGTLRTIGAGILYAGMNCCLLEVIIKAALKKWTLRQVLSSCAIASATLSVFVILLLTAIRNTDTAATAMPILHISSSILTTAAIFVSILTSMFGALLNIAHTEKRQKSLWFLICVSIIAYICSLLGFSNVISIGYPIMGAVMIFYVLRLLYCSYRHSLLHRNHRQG